MIGLILNWLSGGGIAALANAYAKHKDSTVESERIKADVAKRRLDSALEHQKLAAQIRLATAGFWEMRFLTFVIGICFTGHLVAVTLDTIFKLGWRVPAFPSPFDEWQGAIILSFFGIGVVGKGVTTVAAALMARR